MPSTDDRHSEDQDIVAQSSGGSLIDWQQLRQLLVLLRRSPRLFGLICFIVLVLTFGLYVCIHPVYTATAVIGPPSPSPTGFMLSSPGSFGVSGLARSAFGSSMGGSQDPYDDYMQLLPSSRLSQALFRRTDVPQKVFKQLWDEDAHSWKSPTLVQEWTAPLRKLLHRPTTVTPTTESLTHFLELNLTVTRNESGSSSSPLPGLSGFRRVTFKYTDPHEAEVILDTILAEADRLIREDQRHDVESRIKYLRNALTSQQIKTDERGSLIAVLTNQEQILTMIEADSRYASMLVIPPFAPLNPTFPPKPTFVFISSVVLSAALWLLLAYLAVKCPIVGRRYEWFCHRRLN